MRGARDTKRYTRPVPCNASAKLRREFLLTPMWRSNSEERRMLSIKTYLGTAAIAAMVMAAGASSANAWTRAGGGSGPRGSWSSSGSGGCAGGSCNHTSSFTGVRGNTITNTGSTTCAGGSCTHTGTTTGPYGGTVSRSSTVTR